VGFNLQPNVADVPDPAASLLAFLKETILRGASEAFFCALGFTHSGCSESCPNSNHSQIQDLSLQATARLLNLSPASGRELPSLALRSLQRPSINFGRAFVQRTLI
jgi:hypothetical protein